MTVHCWRNDDWQEHPKYSEKTLHQSHSSPHKSHTSCLVLNHTFAVKNEPSLLKKVGYLFSPFGFKTYKGWKKNSKKPTKRWENSKGEYDEAIVMFRNGEWIQKGKRNIITVDASDTTTTTIISSPLDGEL